MKTVEFTRATIGKRWHTYRCAGLEDQSGEYVPLKIASALLASLQAILIERDCLMPLGKCACEVFGQQGSCIHTDALTAIAAARQGENIIQ